MPQFSIKPLMPFLMALVFHAAGAQDYLITSKGDSLAGEIRPLVLGPEKKVQVISSDKKKISYGILQIKEYSFKNEIFHPVRYENGYTFMKLIKRGYLSLYAFQSENQTSFDRLFLVRRDAKYLEVPNLTFKKLMAKFLEDCPGVVNKIENGVLGKREVEIIVAEYNQCIDAKTTDFTKSVVQNEKKVSKANSWQMLQDKVRDKEEFEGKADALEMIEDIKGKIARGEKIPKFLIEGLKNALRNTDLEVDVEAAVNESGN